MTTRKNKSVRLSDEELDGLAQIWKGTHLKEAALIQRAVRKFIADYAVQGRSILFDSPEPAPRSTTTTGSAPANPGLVAQIESAAALKKRASKKPRA